MRIVDDVRRIKYVDKFLGIGRDHSWGSGNGLVGDNSLRELKKGMRDDKRRRF